VSPACTRLQVQGYCAPPAAGAAQLPAAAPSDALLPPAGEAYSNTTAVYSNATAAAYSNATAAACPTFPVIVGEVGSAMETEEDRR